MNTVTLNTFMPNLLDIDAAAKVLLKGISENETKMFLPEIERDALYIHLKSYLAKFHKYQDEVMDQAIKQIHDLNKDS